jgi:ribosomal protein S27E
LDASGAESDTAPDHIVDPFAGTSYHQFAFPCRPMFRISRSSLRPTPGLRERGSRVIEFKCGVCGEVMDADYSAAGRNAQCLKCGTILQVPLPDMLPRLSCPACQAELDFPVSKAGNVERCPKCGGIIRLPNVDGQAPAGCAGLSSLVGVLLLAAVWWGMR